MWQTPTHVCLAVEKTSFLEENYLLYSIGRKFSKRKPVERSVSDKVIR